MSLLTQSLSVPKMSDNNNSLPSQSTFNGSSIDISCFLLAVFLKYIKISFSMHLEAYVASFIFFWGEKVLHALIKPMVPIEIKSSTPTPLDSNLFAIYTTSRKLCVIKTSLASESFFSNLLKISSSSSFERGAGSLTGPFM